MQNFTKFCNAAGLERIARTDWILYIVVHKPRLEASLIRCIPGDTKACFVKLKIGGHLAVSDNEILLIFLLLSIGFVASTVKASEVDSVFQEAKLMVPVNDMGLEQTALIVRGPVKYKLT
jgi:hypothetical protein